MALRYPAIFNPQARIPQAKEGSTEDSAYRPSQTTKKDRRMGRLYRSTAHSRLGPRSEQPTDASRSRDISRGERLGSVPTELHRPDATTSAAPIQDRVAGDGGAEIRKLSELCSLYAKVINNYMEGEIIQTRDPNDKENVIRDEWHDMHYLSVGFSAMHIIVKALLTNLRRPPQSVLDFPCGSGRVTRHLRAMFPEAKIGACDLYSNHV